MIIESNFLNDKQIEDLQMMAEITNAMAVSDGFLNLDACLEKCPENLNVYNRLQPWLCKLCVACRDMQLQRAAMNLGWNPKLQTQPR